MGAKLRERDLGWNKFREAAKAINEGMTIKVGVLDDGKGADVRDGGLTNAQIAAVNEFGSDDGRIPERSFVRSTVNAKLPEYKDDLRKILVGYITGKIDLLRGMNIVGAKAAADIKKAVTTGEPIPPPNAPSVAARKERLTREGSAGSVRTLIDIGRMIASVSWLVVKGWITSESA